MAETQGWQELIARLEKATGPDRELDGAIAAAVGAEHGPREYVHIESRSYDVHKEIASRYTASIDAALTLVPENLWWEVRQLHAPTSPMRSFAGGNGMFHARCGISYGEAGHLGQHDQPAIALCIASLKARGI